MGEQIFISRAGEDSQIASWIAGVLESAGHTCTIQDDFVRGSFVAHIESGMERSSLFLPVLSKAYLAKPYTRAELASYFTEDPDGTKGLIIPVRVEACEMLHPMKHIRYVDFVGIGDTTRKVNLLSALRNASANIAATLSPFLRQLPVVDAHVFGRSTELRWLDDALADPNVNFIQLIAPGGTGKTALLSKWCREQLPNISVFCWSFYNQGTTQSEVSSEPFISQLLSWLHIETTALASVDRQVDLISDCLRQKRILLVIDGIEPLQDLFGNLRDYGLRAILLELAAQNQGLVIISTRIRLADIPDEPTHALSLEVEDLTLSAGIELLRYVGVDHGSDAELAAACSECDNHALSVMLLGTYLRTFCGGAVSHWQEVFAVQVDDTKPGRHARKVMASYARMYAGLPELDILAILGYFNRPADPDAVRILLPDIRSPKFQAALLRLYEARLVSTPKVELMIDCHPMVREYFAYYTTVELHTKLCEHYQRCAPHMPQTAEQMAPLFHAIFHGCRAGLHKKMLDIIFRKQIMRGQENYLMFALGGFRSTLAVATCFFDQCWTTPSQILSESDKAWLYRIVALSLRTVGRLAEALELASGAVSFYINCGQLEDAASAQMTVSELHIILGDFKDAVKVARKGLEVARMLPRSANLTQHLTMLATALHQVGEYQEAELLFKEAETLQAEFHPDAPKLEGLDRYRYADLLLDQGRTDDVRTRFSMNLSLATSGSYIALDHLALGRASPVGSQEATFHLDLAISLCRVRGHGQLLPLALLARGTKIDIMQAFQLSDRLKMRRWLIDCHLAIVRDALTRKRRRKARIHFQEALALVQATGFHRRDKDIFELQAKIVGLEPNRQPKR